MTAICSSGDRRRDVCSPGQGGERDGPGGTPKVQGENKKGLEVAVFDFAGEIVFATETGLKRKKLDTVLFSGTTLDGITGMLKTGEFPVAPVNDSLNGKPAISMVRPIFNETCLCSLSRKLAKSPGGRAGSHLH